LGTKRERLAPWLAGVQGPWVQVLLPSGLPVSRKWEFLEGGKCSRLYWL